MNRPCVTLALFALLVGAVGCKGTYVGPDGEKVTWEYDPDTGDAKAAYERLEEALAENLDALTRAAVTGNAALGELASSNIEDITEAKAKLGFDPRQVRSS